MFIRSTEVVEATEPTGEIVIRKYKVMIPLACIRYVTELLDEPGNQRLYAAGARTGIVWFDGTEARTVRLTDHISEFARLLD